jgi:hypothetical protein
MSQPIIIDRKNHKQEVEALKVDNRMKDMELSKDYVTEWRTYIAEPLQREVGELRTEVASLRDSSLRVTGRSFGTLRTGYGKR